MIVPIFLLLAGAAYAFGLAAWWTVAPAAKPRWRIGALCPASAVYCVAHGALILAVALVAVWLQGVGR